MTLDERRPLLRRLRDAAERISDNLLELELDEIRMALDRRGLVGDSEARWREARETLQRSGSGTARWTNCSRARSSVRGTRARMSNDQCAELTALLTGQSITYRSDNVPIHRRDLLGESVATARCTPDELLTRMSAGFDEVKTVVAAVHVWETLRPRVLETGAALEQNARMLADLGAASLPTSGLRHRSPALGERIARIRCAVDYAAVGRLEAAAAAVQTTLGVARDLPAAARADTGARSSERSGSRARDNRRTRRSW